MYSTLIQVLGLNLFQMCPLLFIFLTSLVLYIFRIRPYIYFPLRVKKYLLYIHITYSSCAPNLKPSASCLCRVYFLNCKFVFLIWLQTPDLASCIQKKAIRGHLYETYHWSKDSFSIRNPWHWIKILDIQILSSPKTARKNMGDPWNNSTFGHFQTNPLGDAEETTTLPSFLLI